MKRNGNQAQAEMNAARRMWGSVGRERTRELRGLVERHKAAQFPSHSGIRFPQNGCVSCAHLGLCLGDQKLIESNLIRNAGASDLAWLNELVD